MAHVGRAGGTVVGGLLDRPLPIRRFVRAAHVPACGKRLPIGTDVLLRRALVREARRPSILRHSTPVMTRQGLACRVNR